MAVSAHSDPQLGSSNKPPGHRKKNSIAEKISQKSSKALIISTIVVMFIGCTALIAYGSSKHRHLFDENTRPFLISSVRSNMPDQRELNSYVSMKRAAWELRRPSMESIEDKGVWPYHRIYLGFFEPVAHCLEEERVGSFNTGGLTVCGLSRLRTKKKCVVYIIAHMPTKTIEHGISQATDSNCEIHTYDPEGTKAEAWEKESRRLIYHAGNPASIGAEMKRHGHEVIDLLVYRAKYEDYALLEVDFLSKGGPVPPIISQMAVIVDDLYGSMPWRTFDLVNFMEGLDMYQYNSEVISETEKILNFINVTLRS